MPRPFVEYSTPPSFLRAESRDEYILVDLIEETFLIGILQDHTKLIVLPKVAIHLEDIRVIHEELQLHLLYYL